MSMTREQLLREMGLAPIWVRRDVAFTASEETHALAVPHLADTAPLDEAAPSGAGMRQPPAMGSVAQSELNSERNRVKIATTVQSAEARDPGRASCIAGLDWPTLNATILACRDCALCERREQAVPGVGDGGADWLFIGEGPGAEEDERGEPFVGQAGRLLDAMLTSIDLKRGEGVYIANAVKCRPPNNRTPEAAELAACRPYLTRQIALIRPRLIVLLGRVAVQSLLGEDASLASLRGKALRYRENGLDIPVLVTYHPAYLLRNLPDKAKAWEDLCRARALMRTERASCTTAKNVNHEEHNGHNEIR